MGERRSSTKNECPQVSHSMPSVCQDCHILQRDETNETLYERYLSVSHLHLFEIIYLLQTLTTLNINYRVQTVNLCTPTILNFGGIHHE